MKFLILSLFGFAILLANETHNEIMFDNCEGGEKTYSDSKEYCISKGMRIPTLKETSNSTINGVPSCSDGWTWTSSPTYYNYYIWNGKEFSLSGITDNDLSCVRCVQ